MNILKTKTTPARIDTLDFIASDRSRCQAKEAYYSTTGIYSPLLSAYFLNQEVMFLDLFVCIHENSKSNEQISLDFFIWLEPDHRNI